ncbi:electron transfer flavoprotein subunit alpha/FixB family protein [Chloroflexota bacterium]
MTPASDVKREPTSPAMVWVFTEQSGGELATVCLEVLGKAKELARELNGHLWAILLGSGVEHLSEELIYHGADKVFLCDEPILSDYDTATYCSVVTDIALEFEPNIILMGATDIGRDLAPRVAARLGTGLTADCIALDIQPETGLLLQTKRGYNGNMMFTFLCPDHRPQMATVRQGVLQACPRDVSRRGEIVPLSVSLEREDIKIRILKETKKTGYGSNLEDAKVVVACGRGIGHRESFRRLEELAQSLGAAVVATKEIVDEGWISEAHMVGQTGITVKPELYIACGISGAIQHACGMWDSGTIVAINKDPKAEIFQIADYGIVGDVNEVISAMIEEIGEKIELTNQPQDE